MVRSVVHHFCAILCGRSLVNMYLVFAQFDAARILEVDRADLLDDRVDLGMRPALPVARRLRLAGIGDELGMPAVEEERQIGMAAPGLDAAGHDGLEIAAVATRHQRALGDVDGRVDAELTP